MQRWEKLISGWRKIGCKKTSIFVTMNFEIIKSKVQLVFNGKPIKKAFLFGSYARMENDSNSDLDILVELDEGKIIGMIEYIKIIQELENVFQTKVDLVTTDGLSKYLAPFVELEKKLIYKARGFSGAIKLNFSGKLWQPNMP